MTASTLTPTHHPKDDAATWPIVFKQFQTCLKAGSTATSAFAKAICAMRNFDLTVEGFQIVLDELVARDQDSQPMTSNFRIDLVEQIGEWTRDRNRARSELEAKEAAKASEDTEDSEGHNRELIMILMKKIRSTSNSNDIKVLIDLIEKLRH